MVQHLIKPHIWDLQGYEIKETPCKVKLDANESPYSYSGLVEGIDLNCYPDPNCQQLREVIAATLNVGVENVLVGNGSDEFIYYLTMVCGGPVLYPTPTFLMYEIISKALGEEVLAVSLDEDFDLDVDAVLNIIEEKNPRLMFLSRPNNPTGSSFSKDRVLKIIENFKGLLVIDEAYIAFSNEPEGFIPDIGISANQKNIIVMRTLSKIGFAALRLGFIVGHRDVIHQINKVRLPYNVSTFSQLSAVRALQDPSFINESVKKVVDERLRVYSFLASLQGIKAYDTEANFVMFATTGKNAPDIHKSLLDRGILIKKLKGPRLDGFFRITVGTKEQNDMFMGALKEIVDG